MDVRIKSENENRVTYGQWECMSLVLNVAIIVGILSGVRIDHLVSRRKHEPICEPYPVGNR